MSNLNAKAAQVLFPSIERATAFITEDKIPFSNAVIGTTSPDPSYKMVISNRPVHVFEYVIEGEGEMLVDGKLVKIQAGDCYVLIAGERHEYRSNPKNPMRKIWINYVADYVPHMLAAYGIRSGVYRGEDTRYYFERLLEIASTNGSADNANYLIAEQLHGIIHAVARSISTEASDEYGIKRALSARVYTKLNLDELASELHISKSQIIRSFKRSEGCTPYEYFLALKIKTAKILLKDTRMQVREIAEKLSICDEHYFSALFRSRVGMTPREYRAKKD